MDPQYLVSHFRDLLKAGQVLILKDLSNTRSNLDENQRYYPDYDRFQVLLCRWGPMKFIIKSLLYPENSVHRKTLDDLDRRYREFNQLDTRFMKYYGRYVCNHPKPVPGTNRGLFSVISSPEYCDAYSSMTRNTLMFFEYIESDMSMLEFVQYNSFNVPAVVEVFIKIVSALVDAYNQCGFVHGDLNLRNILITAGGVALVDFDDSVLSRDPTSFVDGLRTMVTVVLAKVEPDYETELVTALNGVVQDVLNRSGVVLG